MRPQAAAVLLALLPAPALASGSIACSSADGQTSVQLTIGSLPVLSVVQASMAADGRTWTTEGSGDEAVAIGQAFGDEETMRIDFTDANIERIVARLRLFHAADGKAAAMAGILQMEGVGVWALDCAGP